MRRHASGSWIERFGNPSSQWKDYRFDWGRKRTILNCRRIERHNHRRQPLHDCKLHNQCEWWGGGGKPVYTIADVPPGSANAMDDEFTEGSLPGKWTSVLTNSGTFTLFNSQYLQGQAPSSGTQAVSALYQTAPATPWTVTLAMALPSVDNNYLSGGLVIRDSGTGKIVGCTAYNNTQGIRLDNWTNPTTFGGAVGSTSYSNGSQSAHLLYLRFQDDGTNLNCSYSYSGITGTFVTVASEARTSFLANPNQVGIGMLGQASVVAAPVFQWFRRTQ